MIFCTYCIVVIVDTPDDEGSATKAALSYHQDSWVSAFSYVNVLFITFEISLELLTEILPINTSGKKSFPDRYE